MLVIESVIICHSYHRGLEFESLSAASQKLGRRKELQINVSLMALKVLLAVLPVASALEELAKTSIYISRKA